MVNNIVISYSLIMILAAIIIAMIIAFIWWLIKTGKIRKGIPDKLKTQDELKGGENENIKKVEEETDRIRREIERKRSSRRGEEEAGSDVGGHKDSERSRTVPLLPAKQSNEPKRNNEETWPSFD